jgi:hypothetical protein
MTTPGYRFKVSSTRQGHADNSCADDESLDDVGIVVGAAIRANIVL